MRNPFLARFQPRRNVLHRENQILVGIWLSVLAICIMASFNASSVIKSRTRKTSLYLGNGDCEWTDAVDNEPLENPFGTLLTSYPASGMRVTWQQTEGATGTRVFDDFFQLAYTKQGLVKTQYPHYEGIWSYGSNMNQVILVIRNPRWALPSYLTILSELNFAHTWEIAYDHLPEVFTQRAPIEDWIKWRDYRFEEEIRLWGLHIDYYMENGAQYWMPYDFERNGQYPFRFLNESEKPFPQDYHCANDIDDCRPVAIISYERMKDPVSGPDELDKIAKALRGKREMSVMDEDGLNCIWHETWMNTPSPSNDDRDGLPREQYNFTIPQMHTIKETLKAYKHKYSSGIWANNTQAQDLVENFDIYLGEVRLELSLMEDNPGPTPAPNANYEAELAEWYNSKGKGNRYNKAKIQSMGIWDLVKHFYD